MAAHLAMMLVPFLAICSISPMILQATSPYQRAIKSVHCVLRGYPFRVEVAGCQPRDVTINTCLGTCLSMSRPMRSGTKREQVADCTCCQDTKTDNVDVGLWCKDEHDPSKLVKYFHQIKTATECACGPC